MTLRGAEFYNNLNLRNGILNLSIPIGDIPHGHGLSFKRGVADGLLDSNTHESEPHPTHSATYERGKIFGIQLKAEIAKHVKS